MEDLDTLISRFEADLAEDEAKIRAMNQHANHIRLTLTGLRGLNAARKVDHGPSLPIEVETPASENLPPSDPMAPDPTAAARPNYVRPREAWLALVKENPREWSVYEVHQEMTSREWLDPTLSRPVEAVRAAARRLVDVDHLLERVRISSFKPADHTANAKAIANGVASFGMGAALGAAAAAVMRATV